MLFFPVVFLQFQACVRVLLFLVAFFCSKLAFLLLDQAPLPPFHLNVVQQVKFIWVVIHTHHLTQKPWFPNTKPQDPMFGDRSLIEWWSQNGSIAMRCLSTW
jgi:hypothetical protein